MAEIVTVLMVSRLAHRELTTRDGPESMSDSHDMGTLIVNLRSFLFCDATKKKTADSAGA